MDSNNISRFLPILPAGYLTASYLEWEEKFSKMGVEETLSFVNSTGLPIRNFLLFSPLEAIEKKKVPLVILSREITPNLDLNFPLPWFREFFKTFENIQVSGLIVTDADIEGLNIKNGINNILKESNNREWEVESIKSFEDIEGVCEKYIEKIEYVNPISIEYREKK